MEDWENKLLEDTSTEKTIIIEGEKITYRKLGWYPSEKIKSKYISLNPETGQTDLNSADYSKEILEKGIISGPWDPSMKKAVILKFKENVVEVLVKAITGKNTEVKKQDIKKKSDQ